jgi:Ca2+-binding RTX toxin-like protein
MPDFTGTTGNDTLTGTSGSDNIFGLGGADTIDAGDGDDLVVIRGQVGPPPNAYGTIQGGLGIDTLRIDRMYAPVTAQGPFGSYTLSLATLGQTATTIISGFERLQFGSLAGDILSVSMLYGGAAGQVNQIGPGLAANAELIGGAGQDLLNLSYNASVAGGVVTMPSFTYSNWDVVTRAYLGGDRLAIGITGANGATINGSAHVGVQSLNGGAGSDTINGSNDMDLISGGAGGSDFLYGNGGDDTLSVINTYFIAPGNPIPGAESGRTGAGTLFDGGSGFDFLMLGGTVNFQGTLQNIEGLYLQPGYTNINPAGVTIASASQYNTTATFSRATFAQLPTNVLIDGMGDIIINLANGGDSIDVSPAQFDLGALIYFNLRGGDGDDVMTGSLLADNSFTGGAGNDIFNGGFGDDAFYLDGGTDTANGGAGDDYFALTAGTNASIISGGADFDTLQINGNVTLTGAMSGMEYISIGSSSTLNISSANLANGIGPSGIISAQGPGAALGVGLTATETNFVGAGYTFNGATMLLAIIGNTLNNVLAGATNTINLIIGGDGADQIKGFGLNDNLQGGNDNDKIIGNGGSDTLTGGAGNDVFKYRNANDSGLGGLADRIADFAIGADRLNLVNIDANVGTAGDQAFAFAGTGAFTGGGAGSIRYQNSGADLLVQIDINGDSIADMEIVLQGLNGQTLTAADFVL